MIDLNDFKIYVENHKSTRKLYRMYCNKCLSDRGYQRKHRHGMGMCKKCVSSAVHKNKIVSDLSKARMKANNYLKAGGTHPFLGKKHKPETRVKLSQMAVRQNKNYCAKYQYDGPNGKILMKSSWEVRYAEWLDANHIDWIYEPEFKLNNGYSYLPDFQLSTGDIIEVKGYMRNDAQKKWDLFCTDYPQLKKQLIRKADMKRLGLI